MADGPDISLAPIGSVRRTKTGREATEPMREDIRLLGTILGDTVRDQNGEEVFDLVERARVESFRVRRSEIDRAALAGMFDGIDIHQRRIVYGPDLQHLAGMGLEDFAAALVA